MAKLSVLFYEDTNNKSPVLDFVYSLPPSASEKVFRAIRPLEEFGVGTHILGVKKLVGTPIWEVRILGKDSIRIFFVVPVRGLVLILHGFIKKSQKTPSRDIRTAIARLEDWKRRH
jgi:phage-related protein